MNNQNNNPFAAQPQQIANPWEQAAPPVASEMTEEQRNQLLGEWRAAKQALEAAKLREMELRKQVNPIFDSLYTAEKNTGTRSIDLGNGWKAKCRRDMRYSVDSEVMESIVPELEEAIRYTIVKKKFELSKTQYKALQTRANAGEEAAILQLRLLQTAVSSRDATPAIEIVPPKVK